jgi:nucleoside-diphosphate-sugar epimerase
VPILSLRDDHPMRVLVVGGSGYVGRLIVPALADRYTIRVLDPRSPATECEHVAGDATDASTLGTAMTGVDAVLHCAMGAAVETVPEAEAAVDAYDVNVKSVHLTLLAAHAAGVRHAVHISSMSVYRGLPDRSIEDESVPTDATDLYGLTKRLGEQVCRAAAEEWGLSLNVLRLTWPTPDDVWPAWGRPQPPMPLRTGDGILIEATAASDLARAVAAALEFRDGFQIFTISGDRSLRRWGIGKARRLLGWEPIFGISTLNDR